MKNEKYMKNTTIKYLKVKMVVVQIAKAENMTITDEDIRKYEREISTKYKKYPFTKLDFGAAVFCALLLAGAILL